MGRRKSGASGGATLESMKASYREAKAIGDREEESRWANQVGHLYKDKGEYVEALKWFRLDYDIASGRKASGTISPAGLMPTCQCLGEIHYRMQEYKEALIYQEKHFQLAEEAGDLVEQQRASTQLGRTYLDLYESREEEDSEIKSVAIIQKCQKFMTTSMDLAKRLAEMPPGRNTPPFVKELVDAYNNLGLMKMVFDDHRQAEKYFIHGLKICNDEEVPENDEARSRIHHNLGRIYSERRDWKNAKEHMQLDIKICKVVRHLQGEAKGLINFGELAFKRQNYEDAMKIFKRALAIAESLEDEDALVATVRENIRVVNEAEKNMKELLAGIQKLQKLQREVESSSGKVFEVKLLKQEHDLLGELLGQAETLGDWDRFLSLSKQQKRVAQQLGDSGKIGDAYGTMGQAYYNLRLFEKAKKWSLKSFDISKRAKNLEGQSVAKVNYGNALDANGEWEAALKAYEEAYGLSISEREAKMLEQQKSSLENMHYAFTVRFEDFQQAAEVETKIRNVKSLMEVHSADDKEVLCSETDSGTEHIDGDSVSRAPSVRDDVPAPNSSRKRHRIVISDDDMEEEEEEERISPFVNNAKAGKTLDFRSPGSPEVVMVRRGRSISENNELHRDDSARTPSPLNPNVSSNTGSEKLVRLDVDAESVSCSPSIYKEAVQVTIDGHVLHVDLKRLSTASQHPWFITVNMFMEELLRLYKLEKPEGPHPILREVSVRGTTLPSGNVYRKLATSKPDEITVSIAGWMRVPFEERYHLQCEKHKFQPSLAQRSKIKVKDGEVEACDCELDDASFWPLLLALDDIDSLFAIKLAHNRLGRSALNALMGLISETKNSTTGLALDLHDNKLGANSLVEICKCRTTLLRLEVLNLSKNFLTDRVSHDLAYILENTPRLQSLELEGCGLTTPTCEILTNALQPGSGLRKLSVAGNNPIAGYALKALLKKLTTLPSFTDLDISYVQMNRTGVEGIIHLIKETSTLSVLLMRQIQMRPESWETISNVIGDNSAELSRIDLTECKISPGAGERLYKQLVSIPTLTCLNLAGNRLNSQAVHLILEEIQKPNYQLRKLDVSDCDISQDDLACLLESLQGNTMLVELKVAKNGNSVTSGDEIVADSEEEEDEEMNDGFVRRLVKALSMAESLQCVDLSSVVPSAAMEKLYCGWSSCRPKAKRHVQGKILHFFVEGSSCCTSRACCLV